MVCYVYIIQSGRKKGSPIKIGIADNPERRMEELQTGNPEPLILVARIEMASRSAAYDLEAWLHRRFQSANIRGEWFDQKRCGLKRAFGVWNSISKHPVTPLKERKSTRQNQLEIENERLRRDKMELKKKVRELERDMDDYLDPQIDFQ